MNQSARLLSNVRSALSPARLSTYETAAASNTDKLFALKLYSWNAQVSAALLAPLHFCEVAIRNAVSEALTMRYGPDWPWSSPFERSLPNPTRGYRAKEDLRKARNRGATTTGQVIPELKFVFWQKMFTSRHDPRIWTPFLKTVMPGAGPYTSISALRRRIHDDLGVIRQLRNRIAHHEPIFQRDLRSEFQLVTELVELRCSTTAAWMMLNQQAGQLISQEPGQPQKPLYIHHRARPVSASPPFME